jgi:hypothetical protein
MAVSAVSARAQTARLFGGMAGFFFSCFFVCTLLHVRAWWVVVGRRLQAGSALKYGSEELKRDEAVVLRAVSNDGSALRYASEHLREAKCRRGHALRRFAAPWEGWYCSECADALSPTERVDKFKVPASAGSSVFYFFFFFFFSFLFFSFLFFYFLFFYFILFYFLFFSFLFFSFLLFYFIFFSFLLFYFLFFSFLFFSIDGARRTAERLQPFVCGTFSLFSAPQSASSLWPHSS